MTASVQKTIQNTQEVQIGTLFIWTRQKRVHIFSVSVLTNWEMDRQLYTRQRWKSVNWSQCNCCTSSWRSSLDVLGRITVRTEKYTPLPPHPPKKCSPVFAIVRLKLPVVLWTFCWPLAKCQYLDDSDLYPVRIINYVCLFLWSVDCYFLFGGSLHALVIELVLHVVCSCACVVIVCDPDYFGKVSNVSVKTVLRISVTVFLVSDFRREEAVARWSSESGEKRTGCAQESAEGHYRIFDVNFCIYSHVLLLWGTLLFLLLFMKKTREKNTKQNEIQRQPPRYWVNRTDCERNSSSASFVVHSDRNSGSSDICCCTLEVLFRAAQVFSLISKPSFCCHVLVSLDSTAGSVPPPWDSPVLNFFNIWHSGNIFQTYFVEILRLVYSAWLQLFLIFVIFDTTLTFFLLPYSVELLLGYHQMQAFLMHVMQWPVLFWHSLHVYRFVVYFSHSILLRMDPRQEAGGF